MIFDAVPILKYSFVYKGGLIRKHDFIAVKSSNIEPTILSSMYVDKSSEKNFASGSATLKTFHILNLSIQVFKKNQKRSNITEIVLLWYHVFDTYKTHRKIS